MRLKVDSGRKLAGLEKQVKTQPGSRFRWQRRAALLLSVALLTGCARYGYFVQRPEPFAGVISQEQVRTIEYEHLRYGFWEQDGRLAMRIDNLAPELVTIQQERSYIVGPQGRSYALPFKNAPIAPGGYITMTLPPEVPVSTAAIRSGPSVSVGMGFGRSYGSRSRGSYYGSGVGISAPLSSRAGYYVEEMPLWAWKQGEVSLRLAYQTDTGEAFAHDFVFDRRKVK